MVPTVPPGLSNPWTSTQVVPLSSVRIRTPPGHPEGPLIVANMEGVSCTEFILGTSSSMYFVEAVGEGNVVTPLTTVSTVMLDGE